MFSVVIYDQTIVKTNALKLNDKNPHFAGFC
jgi:hypothetical protein